MEAVWDRAGHAPSGAQYSRHRPEETLLYQIIDDYYPDFVAQLESERRSLPRFVSKEFEEYLKCGRLEHGFLRVRCADCHAEKLVAFSCKRRGFCPSCGRFGSALNLNVHFHMLIPDGVYLTDSDPPAFRSVAAPRPEELQARVQRISERIGRHLERQGLLVRDAENSHLAFESEGEESALADLQGHSINVPDCARPAAGSQGVSAAEPATGIGIRRARAGGAGLGFLAARRGGGRGV